MADIAPSVGAAGTSGLTSGTTGVGAGAIGVSVGAAAASFGASTAGASTAGASTAGAGVSFGTSAARAAVVLVGAAEEIAAGSGAARNWLVGYIGMA